MSTASKTVVILQSNYIPWKGYFDLINDADIFVFYDEVKYTKNDWRNRNILNPKGGKHWITIPISKESVNGKISEVVLPDSSWQEKHYKIIFNSYSRAPFFSQISEFISDVYLGQQWPSLSALNHHIIKEVSRMLGIKTEFRNSSEFNLQGNRLERLINILKELNATRYISGPSAKSYIGDQSMLFEKANIQLEYKEYDEYPVYKQFGAPFLNGVSIFDLLSHIELKEAAWYVWGWRAGLDAPSTDLSLFNNQTGIRLKT